MGNIRHCKFAARDRYAGAVAYNEHSSYVKSKNIKFEDPHEELEAVQIAMSVYYELNKNLANCEYLISHMALDCPKGVSVGRELYKESKLRRLAEGNASAADAYREICKRLNEQNC